jgi:hypothetical protein
MVVQFGNNAHMMYTLNCHLQITIFTIWYHWYTQKKPGGVQFHISESVETGAELTEIQSN